MPDLMSYDSNPNNVGVALVADGTGNVVLRGDLDVDFGVGVFEVARLMGPDTVFVALIVAVRSCVFGSVSRMKDSWIFRSMSDNDMKNHGEEKV